jgi:hypothetical protein
MDENILKKMEEMIDKQLNNYIRPPNVDKVKVKSSISFVEVEKISEAKPREDWMKPFPVQQ